MVWQCLVVERLKAGLPINALHEQACDAQRLDQGKLAEGAHDLVRIDRAEVNELIQYQGT